MHSSNILIKIVPSIMFCRDNYTCVVYTVITLTCMAFHSNQSRAWLETITTHLSHQASQKFIFNLLTNHKAALLRSVTQEMHSVQVFTTLDLL